MLLAEKTIIINLHSGRFLNSNEGHEKYNFEPECDGFYGYCPPLDNIDIYKNFNCNSNELFIDGILVIYVQQVESKKFEKEVIGFAPNARVYGKPQPRIDKHKFKNTGENLTFSIFSKNLYKLSDLHQKIIFNTKKNIFRAQKIYGKNFPEIANTIIKKIEEILPNVDDNNSKSQWSDEELHASVEAYFDMLHNERDGKSFVKKDYYRLLSGKFCRSEKSFEYRMQNISYVLYNMGRRWLSGLPPARNVGTNIAQKIESIVFELDGQTSPPIVEFEMNVQKALRDNNLSKPNGNNNPSITNHSINQYQRDAKVKAWILKNAHGKCENCNQKAPFNAFDGTPYLEVHHVRSLADGGPDTVENTIAVCPNCHKELHYGKNAEKLIERLYENIERLNK